MKKLYDPKQLLFNDQVAVSTVTKQQISDFRLQAACRIWCHVAIHMAYAMA